MAQRAKTDEFNLLKAGPWIMLAVIVVLLFYLWPGGGKSASSVKSKNGAESSATSTTASPPANTPGSQAEILSDILNFRSKPSLSGKVVIGTVSKGTMVKIVERKDKWLKVELIDGRVGYLSFDPKYIHIVGEAP